MRGARMTGFLTGRVYVLRIIQLVTKDRLPAELARINAHDLSVVELRKPPAKVNGGSLDLSFKEGAQLSIEVGQYRRLLMTLPYFGQIHHEAPEEPL